MCERSPAQIAAISGGECSLRWATTTRSMIRYTALSRDATVEGRSGCARDSGARAGPHGRRERSHRRRPLLQPENGGVSIDSFVASQARALERSRAPRIRDRRDRRGLRRRSTARAPTRIAETLARPRDCENASAGRVAETEVSVRPTAAGCCAGNRTTGARTVLLGVLLEDGHAVSLG